MAICYLSIGSNLGNKKRNMESAVEELRRMKNTKVLKVSSFIRTKPRGGPRGQPDFLNGALKIKTILPPLKLLKEIKNIEKRLGRARSARNGPRLIDLDILLYADKVIKTRRLVIPHPRMFRREFVIKPLSEVIC